MKLRPFDPNVSVIESCHVMALSGCQSLATRRILEKHQLTPPRCRHCPGEGKRLAALDCFSELKWRLVKLAQRLLKVDYSKAC